MIMRKKNPEQAAIEALAEILETPADVFVEDAMRVYGTDVNTDRSVPDWRDGLKPVHRKLMWAMTGSISLSANLQVKSARIVGDTIGKYSPHGDCLTGDTLVYLLDGRVKSLEDLTEEGTSQQVMSYDTVSQRYVPATAHSFRQKTTTINLYVLWLSNGSEIQCTGNHQFLVNGKDWVAASDLQKGQVLTPFEANPGGSSSDTISEFDVVSIDRILVRKLKEPMPMYDFTVDGLENLVIITQTVDGAYQGVVAHNSSAYGGLVTLVNVPVPPVLGTGNWGTLVNGPAAYRYTNAKWTEFGKSFFHKHYAPLAHKVPNFDGNYQEPLFLASRLPFVFLQGITGIGVGLRTEIPAFTLESVLQVMLKMLATEGDLPVKFFAKNLIFSHQYGGEVVDSPENKKRILDFMSSPKGSVEWTCPLEVFEEKKGIKIHSFAPGVDPIKMLEWARSLPEVQNAIASENGAYVIKAKPSTNMNEFGKLVQKVTKWVTTKVSYEIYVTERRVNKEKPGDYTVEFFTESVPDLMSRWLKWRVNLERASLRYRISLAEKDLAFQRLMALASDNLDVIMAALRKDDPAEHISKGLKITLEQANVILDRKVRSLSKLDRKKIESFILDLEQYLKALAKKLKDPETEVAEYFKAVLASLSDYNPRSGVFQVLINPKEAQEVYAAEEGTDDES